MRYLPSLSTKGPVDGDGPKRTDLYEKDVRRENRIYKYPLRNGFFRGRRTKLHERYDYPNLAKAIFQ